MREAILNAIFGKIENSPAAPFVQELGGLDNYFVEEAPQRTEYPYACSYIVSEADTGGIKTNISEIEWQMTFFTGSLHQGNRLASLGKKFFGNQALVTNDGCKFTCAYMLTVGPMRQNDSDPFSTTITFSCFI